MSAKTNKIDSRLVNIFKKNQITILTSKYRFELDYIDKNILSEFNIVGDFRGKREVVKYLNTLTLNDIDGKNIIITVSSRATFFITPDALKNELTINNINIQRFTYGDNSAIKLNRKEFTTADVKLAKRSLTISRIKKDIKTDKNLTEKLNLLYKSLDIDLRIHNKEALNDINKLATHIIEKGIVS